MFPIGFVPFEDKGFQMVSLHPACCSSQHLLLSGVKKRCVRSTFLHFFFNLTVSLFHLIPEGGPTGHRALD